MARLIHSAGLAIQALTNAKPDDAPSSADTSLDAHKKRFKDATAQYFALLSSIDVRLRRQVYALEEAALLAPDSASRSSDVPGAAGAPGASSSLDISWLNSRKDTVGKDKEAELWSAARKFVEENGKATDGKPSMEAGDGHDNMEVD